jgi:uncharacterized membrane protein
MAIENSEIVLYVISIILFVVGHYGNRFYQKIGNQHRAEFSHLVGYGIGLAPFMLLIGRQLLELMNSSSVTSKIGPNRGLYILFALFSVIGIAYCSMIINDVDSNASVEDGETAKILASVSLVILLIFFIINAVYIYKPTDKTYDYQQLIANARSAFPTKAAAYGNMHMRGGPALFGFGH